MTVVKGGLHSFVFEIARVSKSAGPHFSVWHHHDGYVIEHHNGKWRVLTDAAFSAITVETDDGQLLSIAVDTMTLDGIQVDQICAVGYHCFDAKEIRRRVALSILAWAALEGGESIKAVVNAVSTITGEPP
jgi:hypothetical protein